MVRRTLVVGLVLALGACGSRQYAQAPAPIHEEEVWVSVPSRAEHGEVRIEPQGVRRVVTSTGAQVDALLVRMIVTNDSSHRPWTLDTRQQLMVLPTGLRTPPLVVDVEGARDHVISVRCGDRRVVDLYYVMPPAGFASLPSFDVMWELNAGDALVSRTTEVVALR
jgi:hypothetical protein